MKNKYGSAQVAVINTVVKVPPSYVQYVAMIVVTFKFIVSINKKNFICLFMKQYH